MVSLALSYGLITLTTLWAAAGAQPSGIEARMPIAFVIFLAVYAVLVRLKGDFRLECRPLGFDSRKDLFVGMGTAVGLILVMVGVRTLCGDYFLDQAHAIRTLNGFGAGALVLALAASDRIYRRFFAPEWGDASAAFLEALTWGLALQSLVGFLWIYASGWLISKFTTRSTAWGSVIVRLALGLAWITLA